MATAAVLERFEAHQAQVGDFKVRRVLPQRLRRMVGPVCFLDHMGPHVGVGDASAGVGPHPHIGLATVTFLFDGELFHRDTLGTEQVIRPGDVNWMKAGRGIVHSERTPKEHWGQRVGLHGLQMWVALPLGRELDAPTFEHAPQSTLPRLESSGVGAQVLLGRWGALESKVQLASPTFYLVATLEPGAQLELETQYSERAVYAVEGDVSIDGESFGPGHLRTLSPGATGCVTAQTASRVAIFGGEPLEGPRLMWWNFVSSNAERIAAAKVDWRAGNFGHIAGETTERMKMPGE